MLVRALAIAVIAVLAAVVLEVPAAPAARGAPVSSAGRWPLGTSAAPAPPRPTAYAPGLVALGRDRVLVFGGGEMGESVATPDGHRDVAVFSLTSQRWRRVADLPFGAVLPAGVWTGHEVVAVGGVPRCADQQCRASTTRAAVYDPASDSWRSLTVPESLRNYGSMDPLTWTGQEALFLHGQEVVAINPAGRWRTVPLPGIAAVGSVCATRSTVAVLTSRLLRRDSTDDAATQLLLYDATADRWTTTADAPSDALFASLACGEHSVFPIPGEFDRAPDGLVRYDTAARKWAVVPTPTLAGFVPCTTTASAAACDLPRWSGHGRFLDGWLVGKDGSGMRFDTASDTWTPIATGPDLQPLAPPGDMAWAGRLGVTFATAQGPGSGTGPNLLVYRPN